MLGFILLMLVIPILILVWSIKKSEQKYTKTMEQINAQASLCNSYIKELKSAHSVIQFFNALSLLESSTETLLSYRNEDASISNSLTDSFSAVEDALSRVKADSQWLLRDTIERQAKTCVKSIRNELRNSREHKINAYHSFCHEMQQFESRFSDETKELAENYESEIYRAIGLPINRINLFPDKHIREGSMGSPSIAKSMEETDKMDGPQFEQWCAILLKDNGFTNVSVTRGSGDQGVDILASKGGVRYAFQCKCYNSSLGNTPVQEVHAGKDIYNCHVGVVMTNSHFTAGAIEAAQRTNTLLWDRDTLAGMIK